MESIQELQKICQGTIHKDASNVYMRFVCRPLSIRMTRYVLPTPVTADQVSQAMIAAGFLSAFVLALPWKFTFFMGAILLQLWYLIDCMDGEVARYRYYQKTGRISIDKRDTSLTGMYYDMINHYLMNFLVPAAVAFGLFLRTGSVLIVLAGAGASLAQILLLAMHDARSRAVLSHLKKYDVIRPVKKEAKERSAPKDRSLAHQAFAVMHYSMTYPTVMNLVLFAAILTYALPSLPWRGILLGYLSAASIVVAATLVVREIQQRTPDAELNNGFLVSDESSSV